MQVGVLSANDTAWSEIARHHRLDVTVGRKLEYRLRQDPAQDAQGAD